MIVIENPALSRLMLDHLADLYNIKKKREGIHLSTLVYCLTRSFFDAKQDVEPTDQEIMLFSLGYGLQDVLTPKEATAPVYEKDGITFSPDFVIKLGTEALVTAEYTEIKTTRMSTARNFPETWIEYIMGGCYMQTVKDYNLSVLHILGNYKPPFPQIKSYKLQFTSVELEENWKYLMTRKQIFQEALESNIPPTPGAHCKDWECKNCRFKVQCDALAVPVRKGGVL